MKHPHIHLGYEVKLRISDDLSLPLDFVTSTQAILAKRRVGKSYTASVLAEEMLKAGQQIVAVDPTGAWYGLKSSADGQSKGFPIAVLGGEHGDVPLDEHVGETIAGAIVADRFSAVLDLSLFRKGQLNRFMASFLETLYRLNREAMHLFVDEADAIAPQRVFGDEARVLGAMQDVVRRGGIRGIGCTLITQRPAVLNKDVLTQCEVLTTLRLVHPLDIKAVMEWVNVHADPVQAQEMIDSLPSLPVGTAYVWSPAMDLFRKVKIRQRETFDSGATPKAGQAPNPPKVLAKVDVEQLGKAIADAARKAKENDPASLKKRIAELEKQLAARPTEQKIVEKEKIVEVPVLKNGQLDRTEKLAGRLDQLAGKFLEQVGELRRLITPAATPRPAPADHRHVTTINRAAAPAKKSRPATDANSNLPRGEKSILTVAAMYPDGASKEQMTVLTGYKRSSRDTYIQRLRERGLIEESGGLIVATSDGMTSLGSDFEPLPTGDALRDYWMQRLPEGERKVLDVLIENYPNAVNREQIDERTGYKRSSRDTYLQRLGSRRLVQVVRRGDVKASDELFG
jgi:hypothetical protein